MCGAANGRSSITVGAARAAMTTAILETDGAARMHACASAYGSTVFDATVESALS